MDNIIRKIGPFAKWVCVGALFGAAAFSSIAIAAGFGGGFMPVVGTLLIMLFNLALIAAIPLLYVLKKQQFVPYALGAVLMWWLISGIYNHIGDADMAIDYYSSLTIARGVFSFLIGLAMMGALAMGILYVIKREKRWLQIALCILAGSLLLFLINWAMTLAVAANFGADWDRYFDIIAEYLLMPVGMVFAIFDYLFVKTGDTNRGPKEALTVKIKVSEKMLPDEKKESAGYETIEDTPTQNKQTESAPITKPEQVIKQPDLASARRPEAQGHIDLNKEDPFAF